MILPGPRRSHVATCHGIYSDLTGPDLQEDIRIQRPLEPTYVPILAGGMVDRLRSTGILVNLQL